MMAGAGIMAAGGGVDVGQAALSARTVTSNVQPPDTALAEIAFRETGNLETRVTNASFIPIAGEWFVSGVKEDMELIVTTISGTPSGTPSGWVSGVAEALGVINKQWARNQPTCDVGFLSWTASYEIKHTPTGTTLAGPVNITLRGRCITI